MSAQAAPLGLRDQLQVVCTHVSSATTPVSDRATSSHPSPVFLGQ